MAGACVEDEHCGARRSECSRDRESGGGILEREPGDKFSDEPGVELEVPVIWLEEAAQWVIQRLRQEDRAVFGPDGPPRRESCLTCQHDPRAEHDRGEIRQPGPDGGGT